MNLLWTGNDLVSAMNGRPVGQLPEGITGISIDSRTIKAGEAFFAIKGERFDGHDFVSLAAANGAALVVVSEARLPALGRLTVPMIVVDDVLAALVALGIAARARSKARIVAVTGSVGKTTTKEMLRHMLGACGSVHASAASFNNHWGVPLTLARMPETTDYGVFEIGMNHPDEIRPLVKMVRPHVAIVTTVAAAHLGNFKSLTGIAAAKAEIFEGLTPDGTAIVNRDNEKYAYLTKAARKAGASRVVSFGAAAEADIRLLDIAIEADRSLAKVKVFDRSLDVTVGAPGRHIVQNVLAALGAAQLLGADLDKAAAALQTLTAEAGRGARHRLAHAEGPFTLIDESYNANPASMRAALELLKASVPEASGRRIAVLGDMLELGRFSQALHRELGEPVRASGADLVFLAGPEMAALAEALKEVPAVAVRHYPDAAALAGDLSGLVAPGDVVMVKSSLGIGFGRIVAALKAQFPADDGRSMNVAGKGN